MKVSISIAVACVALSQESPAQVGRDSTTDWLVSANSEVEGYLRTLQLVGAVPLYPWSIRAFSAAELRGLAPADTMHPWARSLSPDARAAHWRFISPDAGVIYNSRFPYGSNDGPVWAGRGVTSTLTLGVRATYGVFDLIVAPQLFRAQNAEFPLAPNGLTGTTAFANARFPTRIDYPQRFGTTPYQRVDPGQSTARVSVLGISAGVSTANEFWGPAVAEPFLLSNNAAGFRHVFFGTAQPLGVGGMRVHLRTIAGRLDQSEYSTTDMTGIGRYLSGLVGVVTFRQLPGLELGGGRLFHNTFADSNVTLREVVAPVFQALLKVDRAKALGTFAGDEPDNQLASIFGRWVFLESGFEVYGEYGREDNAYDLRDLLEEPDHDVAFILGFRKAWKRPQRRIVILRSEVFNARLSHLYVVRQQQVPYVHDGGVNQGHTNLGQILGAPDLFGGGGQLLAVETYGANGRTSVQYSRTLRGQLSFGERGPRISPFDVVHAITVEQMSFFRGFDFVRGVTAVYELDRDFSGDDAVNVRVTAGVRAHW